MLRGCGRFVHLDDLLRIDAADIQVISAVDKAELALSLKKVSPSVRDFFGNMSERAAKFLKDDIEALGAVRPSDVEKAHDHYYNGQTASKGW